MKIDIRFSDNPVAESKQAKILAVTEAIPQAFFGLC